VDLETRVAADGRCAVVVVVGDVDIHSAEKLHDHLERLTAEGAIEVVLDLGRMPFIDSTGLGTLVAARKRVRAIGGDLRLINPGPGVTQVLKVTNLARMFLGDEPRTASSV
jgi:anti-sigma B factor antagonist